MWTTIGHIVQIIAVIVLYIEWRKEYKRAEYYRDKAMAPIIHKLKAEEAPILDVERIKYAKTRFKKILSTFLFDYYGKRYKTITNKLKHSMRLEIIPLIPIIKSDNLEIKLTEFDLESKMETLQNDFNAYTDDSSCNDLINDILDIIL